MKTKVVQLNLPPTTERSVSTLTKGLTRVPEIRDPANRPENYWLLQPEEEGQGLTVLSTSGQGPVLYMTITVKFLLSRRLARSQQTLNCAQYLETGPESRQTVNFANLNYDSHAHFVHRQPQKKGISPATVKQNQKLKCVNNVSCVD